MKDDLTQEEKQAMPFLVIGTMLVSRLAVSLGLAGIILVCWFNLIFFAVMYLLMNSL